MDKFRSRKPYYNDDSDYTTNSPSYYDDLARKNRLIEMLAKRIWEYDKELAKRFEEWDKQIRELPDELKRMFLEWVDDGTLARILAQLILDEYATMEWVEQQLENYDTSEETDRKINEFMNVIEDLFNDFKIDINDRFESFKNDVNNNLEELRKDLDGLLKIENEFDFTEHEPVFLTNLGGIRNAVNQSINIDPVTNQMYVTQSDSKSPEGFYISRLTPSGKYIDSMLLKEGGHGTTIGLDCSDDCVKIWAYHTGNCSDDCVKIWAYHTGKGKLIYFKYKGNSVLTPSQVDEMTDYTPDSLVGTYFTPVYDSYFDNLLIRRSDGRMELRKRDDIVKHIDRVDYIVDVDPSENTNPRPMQGAVAYGTDFYWLSGGSSNAAKIQKYDFKTNKKVEDYIIKDMVTEDGTMLFKDNFKEPEGMTIYRNKNTGKLSLLFVITTGGIEKRYHMLYAFNQRGAYEHWLSNVNSGSQKYKFTRSDGRALSIKDNIKSLNEITDTGIYYLTNKQAKSLSGFPYPVGVFGWYVEVSAKNQLLGGRQTIRRYTQTNVIIEMTRTFTLDRETFKHSFGNWSKPMIYGQNQEYLDADEWGKKLSNVLFGGEYYLTSPQMNNFTDTPSNKKGGYRLYVSNPDSMKRVRQTLELNSDVEYQIFFRNVNIENKSAGDWVEPFKK